MPFIHVYNGQNPRPPLFLFPRWEKDLLVASLVNLWATLWFAECTTSWEAWCEPACSSSRRTTSVLGAGPLWDRVPNDSHCVSSVWWAWRKGRTKYQEREGLPRRLLCTQSRPRVPLRAPRAPLPSALTCTSWGAEGVVTGYSQWRRKQWLRWWPGVSDLCTAVFLAQSRICGRKDLVRLSKALGYLSLIRPLVVGSLGELNSLRGTYRRAVGRS